MDIYRDMCIHMLLEICNLYRGVYAQCIVMFIDMYVDILSTHVDRDV